MLVVEVLSALFMVAAFIVGIGLLIADQQARHERVRQESGAWRRPRQ